MIPSAGASKLPCRSGRGRLPLPPCRDQVSVASGRSGRGMLPGRTVPSVPGPAVASVLRRSPIPGMGVPPVPRPCPSAEGAALPLSAPAPPGGASIWASRSAFPGIRPGVPGFFRVSSRSAIRRPPFRLPFSNRLDTGGSRSPTARLVRRFPGRPAGSPGRCGAAWRRRPRCARPGGARRRGRPRGAVSPPWSAAAPSRPSRPGR